MHPQLTLAFESAPAKSFDTFHVAADAALAARSIEAFARGTLEERQIYLWGASGAGKSHLLAAACRTVSAAGYRTAYLPGELISQPTALEGLESMDLVCLDDLQKLDQGAETDLARCIDRCRQSSARMLFAADRPVEQLDIALRDLATRLNWGPVFHIDTLSEASLVEAVRGEFSQRSLEAADEVLSWLIRRFPRDMASIKQLVVTLDAASLSEQRRITIPFIKQVLSRQETPGQDPGSDGEATGSEAV